MAFLDVYEPGSIMKVFTAAAALEEKVIDLDTVFPLEHGDWALDDLEGNVIHDITRLDEGNIGLESGHSSPGSYVDLRFEMDTLVLMHSCPHPLNEAASYPRASVRYQIYRALPVAPDDLCRSACPENRRGFENNAIYHLEGAV